MSAARVLGPSEVEAEVDVSPFDLAPEAASATDAAALCLHGLTGTPYEVRPVAEALAKRGVRAKGIWMAGHNGSVDDLAATHRDEWVGCAREALQALRREHATVFLVGVSMGGLVSLRLAQTEGVDALVTVGVPLALAPPIPQLLPLVRLFATGRPKKGSDLCDPEASARHPHFPVMPFDAVRELVRLQGEVVPALSAITAPILVAHGKQDQTARPEDAERLFAAVSTPEADRELFLLERSAHVATVDYDGPALCTAAADFLSRRAGVPSA
ncbi:MAG: alpha/beta fold hydrolase [Myxococcota bacterium]